MLDLTLPTGIFIPLGNSLLIETGESFHLSGIAHLSAGRVSFNQLNRFRCDGTVVGSFDRGALSFLTRCP